MKKQKLTLGRLSLNKERISGLDAGQVTGGAPLSVNIPCQVTLLVNCQQTILCPTRQVLCRTTRIPICADPLTVGAACPPVSLACNPQTLACGPGGF
ncbi:class I lanthipeptide [Taibaiella koreensis]|uniref:class I lanthipeptide n=1 Tax=Taibaiella koreensis TaxID=1268548 RepID=UPI000E599DC1|nr:class I lanthipeptide [Taibaiella koreensis]